MGGKPRLSHVGGKGEARMVGVSNKKETFREATAFGLVSMQPATFELFKSHRLQKGDILAVARIAGIQAAKKTSEWIPLCHPIRITQIEIDFSWHKRPEIKIACSVKALDRTGVEMEALCGAMVAALAIYDMCKAVDPDIVIGDLKLLEKKGGKRGDWKRQRSRAIDVV